MNDTPRVKCVLRTFGWNGIPAHYRARAYHALQALWLWSNPRRTIPVLRQHYRFQVHWDKRGAGKLAFSKEQWGQALALVGARRFRIPIGEIIQTAPGSKDEVTAVHKGGAAIAKHFGLGHEGWRRENLPSEIALRISRTELLLDSDADNFVVKVRPVGLSKVTLVEGHHRLAVAELQGKATISCRLVLAVVPWPSPSSAE